MDFAITGREFGESILRETFIHRFLLDELMNDQLKVTLMADAVNLSAGAGTFTQFEIDGKVTKYTNRLLPWLKEEVTVWTNSDPVATDFLNKFKAHG